MILIAGVLVMAIGAWYMPWYQGQLGMGALQDVGNDLSDTRAAVDDVKKDLSGDGLTGKQDLVSLLSAGTDEDDLKSLMGSDFDDFKGSFFKKDTSFNQFQNVKVQTIEPAHPRQLIPATLAGFDVAEFNGGAPLGVCGTNGVEFTADPDTVSGTINQLKQLLGPSSFDGFVITAPADLDGATANNPANHKLMVTICLEADNPPFDGKVIAQEIFQIGTSQTITKNFDFGVIPPGLNIRVLLDDASDEGVTYNFWMIRNDPFVQNITTINDLNGSLGDLGNACTSITVTVKDGATTPANISGANVNISHSFLPLSASKQSAVTTGVAAFTAGDFGGKMPPGTYFIDVLPPAGKTTFPFNVDVECGGDDNVTSTATVTAILPSATQFAGSISGATTAGVLTIKAVDQFGAPVVPSGNKALSILVDAEFAPIYNDICLDGDTADESDDPNDDADSACGSPPQHQNDVSFFTNTENKSTGTATLTGLPLPGTSGQYFIDVCTAENLCGFAEPVLTSTAQTVIVEIFIPKS